MAGSAWSARSWRSGKVLGAAALACGLLGACAGGTPSAPSTPAPTPIASGGFLHVLQGGTVLTYAIDGVTGRLRESARQTVGDAHTLAGEPQGRYVYVAFGPRDARPPYDGPKPSIVAYVPDGRSGSLAAVSEQPSDPIWRSSQPVRGGWSWLDASSTRVYALWETVTYHDVYHTYVTHAVSGDGRLGSTHQEGLDERDPDGVAVDVSGDGDVFYKGTWTGGLTAHRVESDGSLTQVGRSGLCVASKVSRAQPLVAARGLVLAWSLVDPDQRAVCSWEGPGLAPRASLGLDADYAVALRPRGVPSAGSSTAASRTAALVAMRTSHLLGGGDPLGREYDVRLFAMGDDGALQPLDAVQPGYARQLLFDPSGGFLYVSHATSASSTIVSLTVYSIDAQGRLGILETLEGGGGAMAVTTPPQARASTGPATD